MTQSLVGISPEMPPKSLPSECVTGRVLVLGEDTRSFLAVIRSLGRAGLDVHVAWCPLTSAALASKYVGSVHHLPEYRSDDDSWLKAFNTLLEEQRFELILPCTDGTILPLQLHRREIEDGGRIQLLPDDVYRICSSKAETYRLAEELGISLPRQTMASSMNDLRRAAQEFGFTLILKPQTSSSAANPLARRAVRLVHSAEDLESCGESMLADGELIVQQCAKGIGVGVEVLCKDGVILTAFQHQRVHEPRRGGGSSYRKSVPLNPEMFDATEKLMRALRYTGVAMVEFKQNQETGAWVLIEINARFWGSLPLSIAAGLDFPRYLYEMTCRGKTEFPRIYRQNVFSRHWSSDLEWLISNFRDHDPGTPKVPALAVASEISNLLCLRERSDTLALDDPRPAFADVGGFVRGKVQAIAKRSGLWRKGERRRALQAIRKSHHFLFVCYGNICRSPFAAAALLKLNRPGVTAACSGYYPRAKRVSPSAAAEAARRFGVDLESHRSKVLTPEDVESADLIFVFDRRTMDALEGRFANLKGKTHFLGALEPAASLEIEDPYGGSVEHFVECYARINRILESVFGSERLIGQKAGAAGLGHA